MPQPSKKERIFQTSLCKQGAGIAWETIAMAMVEGLEKQLGSPGKKSPVLKRFCPQPIAKCPPATSEPQHRACLAASPPSSPAGDCDGRAAPYIDTNQALRPHQRGGQKQPWVHSAPCSLPQLQAAVPHRTQGWGTPSMAGPTFQSVSTAERKTSEFSWGAKELLGTETSSHHGSLPPTLLSPSS